MIRSYFLHVADDKKDGKIDPNDHVNEIILPSVGKVAEEEEDKGGRKVVRMSLGGSLHICMVTVIPSCKSLLFVLITNPTFLWPIAPSFSAAL